MWLARFGAAIGLLLVSAMFAAVDARADTLDRYPVVFYVDYVRDMKEFTKNYSDDIAAGWTTPFFVGVVIFWPGDKVEVRSTDNPVRYIFKLAFGERQKRGGGFYYWTGNERAVPPVGMTLGELYRMHPFDEWRYARILPPHTDIDPGDRFYQDAFRLELLSMDYLVTKITYGYPPPDPLPPAR